MVRAKAVLASEEAGEGRHRASMRRLREIDWDFPSQPSESAFSSLHWHPCRFPSQIPAIAVARLTSPGDTVLDPFMGSGTTLVEAQRLGRRSTGIDVNPVSCLIAESKTLSIESSRVRRFVERSGLFFAKHWNDLRADDAPGSVQGSKWYMPETLDALRKIWTVVQKEQSDLKVIGESAFSSILLPACRETRHWGYVCDNTTPKTMRKADPKALFISSLEQFALA